MNDFFCVQNSWKLRKWWWCAMMSHYIKIQNQWVWVLIEFSGMENACDVRYRVESLIKFPFWWLFLFHRCLEHSNYDVSTSLLTCWQVFSSMSSSFLVSYIYDDDVSNDRTHNAYGIDIIFLVEWMSRKFRKLVKFSWDEISSMCYAIHRCSIWIFYLISWLEFLVSFFNRWWWWHED